MKKKIALLLAAVMALTTLPMTSVFAANYTAASSLSKSALVIPNDDDSVQIGPNQGVNFIDLKIDFQDLKFADPLNPSDPTSLNGRPNVGNRVDAVLDLTNAEWNFDNMPAGTVAATNVNSSGQTVSKSTGVVYTGNGYTLTVLDSLKTEAVLSITSGSSLITSPVSDAVMGTVISADAYTTNVGIYTIPMAVKANGKAGNATVEVMGNNVNDTTLTFAITAAAKTTIDQIDTDTAYDTLTGINFRVNETRPNVITNGLITLVAPGDVTFNYSNANDNNAYGSAGLSGATAQFLGTSDDAQYAYYLVKGVPAGGSLYKGSLNFRGLSVTADRDAYSSGDEITIDVVNGFDGDWDGSLAAYINANASGLGVSGAVRNSVDIAKANITDSTTITVGTVIDEGITFTADDATALVSGKYPDKIDDSIKAAKVYFKETTAGSWSSNKLTTFSLPDGVSFYAVDFDTYKIDGNDPISVVAATSGTAGNVKPGDSVDGNAGQLFIGQKDSDSSLGGNGRTVAKLNADSLELRYAPASLNSPTEIDFIAYLSISPEYVAANGSDIEMTMSCANTDDQTVTIATVQDPFTFDYVQDATNGGTLTITENFAGAFERNKYLAIELDDVDGPVSLGRNMKVTEDTNALSLTGKLVKGTDYTSGMALGGNKYWIDTTRVSNTRTGAATFRVTGIPYVSASDARWLVVGGSAIAENYDSLDVNAGVGQAWAVPEGRHVGTSRDALFDAPGWVLGLGTAADQALPNPGVGVGKYSSTFVIGQTSYTMNGEEYQMDVAPIMDGNNAMIPVRYLANALGFSDDNIIWNADTQTATLVAPNQYVVQLTVGSPNAVLNGVSVLMNDYEGNPVSAINQNDRVYLPVRAVGNLFGVTLAWDQDTQTISIN